MMKIVRWRTYIVVLGMVAAVILFGTLLFAYFNAGPPPRSTPIYPRIQGLYESCSPSQGPLCLDRLAQMARAGFTLVINYDQLYGNADQQLAYANRAHALGMQVIWGLSDPAFWNGTDLLNYYRALAATCGCSDNEGFIRYVVSLAKSLPATWGYYVGDEVRSGDHARMKAFADLIKRLDPLHPRLYIAGEDSSTMGTNLEPFVDTAEFIGGDIYPVGTSEPITTVGGISRAIQSIADRNGRQAVIVLQAFSWAQYAKPPRQCFPGQSCNDFPTEDQLRQMRDLAAHNAHPRFLLWYSYFDIVRSGNALEHWLELISAIEQPQ